MKNVIALACGMAAGVGLGQNTLATIITRGFGRDDAFGRCGRCRRPDAGGTGRRRRPRRHLRVTAVTQPHLRVRAGSGQDAGRAQAATNGQVAEGVKSCASVKALAERYGVDMPLTDAVDQVCPGLSVSDAIASLLGRAAQARDPLTQFERRACQMLVDECSDCR